MLIRAPMVMVSTVTLSSSISLPLSLVILPAETSCVLAFTISVHGRAK